MRQVQMPAYLPANLVIGLPLNPPENVCGVTKRQEMSKLTAIDARPTHDV